MTALFVGLMFGTGASGALAGKPDCREIEVTGERLACYDAAFPPKAKKAAAVESNASYPTYKDPFVTEEARTAAKLKNICRGC
jgi:Type VI secretion system VasI, EvfG, VC_A0118